jgi:outer membrane protein assembly factor BamB
MRTTLLGALVALMAAPPAGAQWAQWGGPSRDFVVSVDGLADSWPEGGPPEIWRRPLGTHGHSGILVEGGFLYTAYRDGEDDVILAADPGTGQTRWEHRDPGPLPADFNDQFGPGPHSTPLVVDGRLFAISSTLVMTALDAREGTLLWQRNLATDMGASTAGRGYGASPLAWRGLLIAYVGGDGQAVVAFDQATGEVVWKALNAPRNYSSPVLAEIEGVEQVVVTLGAKRAGLAPADGRVLWEIDFPETALTTFSTVSVHGNRIFSSSAYADGSRLVEITRDGDAWSAKELWYTRKMRVMHGAFVPFGDLVYGSSGDFGPTFLAALRLDDGELAFRDRGFAKANVIRIAENRALVLDEDGVLALAEPSPHGMKILASAKVLEGVSWTVPTVVGTRVYVRNRTEMAALELGGS